MESSLILVAILAIAVLGKADSVAIAVTMLLGAKLLHLDGYVYQLIEKKGMFAGLVILIMAILIPLAKGDFSLKDILGTMTSWVGILALVLSLATTYLSGLGARYLTEQGNGDVMPSLIVGAVIAAAFLGGVPVGPLITSGILAVAVRLFHRNLF
ncbi:MAG: DUF441 domain-containing protein [Clostridiaceae bacterium]